MGISGRAVGGIGSVKQCPTCCQQKLQDHTPADIGEQTPPVLPHTVIEIKQRKADGHHHRPPSTVSEKNDCRKEQQQQTRICKIGLCQLLLYQSDEGTDDNQPQQDCDHHCVTDHLQMPVDLRFLNRLFCKLQNCILIIKISADSRHNQVNQIIQIENLLHAEHSNYSQREPEHFLTLRHSVMNVIESCHILAAATDGTCEAHGLKQILNMCPYIFPGKNRRLSVPVMIDSIKKDCRKKKYADKEKGIIQHIISAGTHQYCAKAEYRKHRHHRIGNKFECPLCRDQLVTAPFSVKKSHCPYKNCSNCSNENAIKKHLPLSKRHSVIVIRHQIHSFYLIIVIIQGTGIRHIRHGNTLAAQKHL